MKITMFSTVVVFVVLMGLVPGRVDAAPAFAQAPRVEKEGDGYVITFAVRSECDVTVWVAAAKTEQIVRHLAVGRLGANAPEPFQKGTLKQRLVWDGMLYLNCGKALTASKDMRWVIRRYTPEGKPVPFKNGEGIKTLGYHAGTHSGEKCGSFDVGPDGSIYVSECSEPGGRVRARLNVYGPDGDLVKEGLISETTHTAVPLAVDGLGRLYVAGSLKRPGKGPGWEFPAFLGADPRSHFRSWYGTVFRFGPAGGAFRHVGIGEKHTHVGGYPGGKGRVVVEGAMWEYFGMSPMPQSSTCECKVARLEADGFGRVFVPDICTYSVQVLDPAGNLIMRFGAYGNRDAQGTGSDVAEPEIPLYYPTAVAALDRYVAVTDNLNRRVIEVRLSYQEESSVPVP